MQYFVGCCGWSEARAKYFADFPVVEVQSTFYEPPSVALATKWREAAPVSFQFCVKAWQLITHRISSPTYRRLKTKLSATERDFVGAFQPTEQVRLAWERTADIARVLHAEVILFQCPASFEPNPENLRHLRAFFSARQATGKNGTNSAAIAADRGSSTHPGKAVGDESALHRLQENHLA